MMLTDDTTKPNQDPKKPPIVTKVGERNVASKFFEDKAISNAARAQILGVTVRLRTKSAPFHVASGVILAALTNKTLILTAKHVLYTLSGLKVPGEKVPANFNTKTFRDSIEIGYHPVPLPNAQPPGTPPALLTEPTASASVNGINFAGTLNSDQNWKLDLVILVSTDQTLLAHATQNRFLTKDQKLLADYAALLAFTRPDEEGKGGKGAIILNTELFEYFQLGYGIAKTPDLIADGKYTSYEGKVQCKQSWPTANMPMPLETAYEIDKEIAAKDWPVSNEICMLDADVSASTAPGDSGGPLFCRPKADKVNKNTSYLASQSNFYLVGINTGANFFSGPEYKKPNADLPREKIIHNNAVTYWRNVYDALL